MLKIFLLLFCICFFAGCRVVGTKGPKAEKAAFHKTSKAKAEIHEYIDNFQFEGSVKKEDIEVFYPAGLKKQAYCFADIASQSLLYINKLTGISPYYKSISFFLIQVDTVPFVPISLFAADLDYEVVLFLERDEPSCEGIITQNATYPVTFIHEVIEGTLVSVPYSIKSDYIVKKQNVEKINYTRWFREGFSTYCGWLALESIINNKDFDKKNTPYLILVNGVPLNPFSALAKIKTDIFRWNNFSNLPTPNRPNLPYDCQTMADYYEGAFGLFLLIREKFGDDAICNIIKGIDKLEYADGPALIKLTNEVLNADINQIVEDFNFPQTGLFLDPLFPGMSKNKGLDISEGCQAILIQPGSPAEKAGIYVDDVIYKINGKDIKANLDFEFAIFHLMDQPSVNVSIWRKGEGYLVKELKLKKI